MATRFLKLWPIRRGLTLIAAGVASTVAYGASVGVRQPVAEQTAEHPICIGILADGTTPGTAAVSIDGGAITMIAPQRAADGSRRFVLPPVGAAPNAPDGRHLLLIRVAGHRTKAILFTAKWIENLPVIVVNGDEQCRTTDFVTTREPLNAIDAIDATAGAPVDDDRDGIDDRIEDWLAERFAPIVHHGEDETSFPVSVEWWLARTSLGAFDATAFTRRERRIAAGPLQQTDLLNHTVRSERGNETIESSGARSRGKQLSFYLENVSELWRTGERQNPSDWITYVHSYPNESGGVTLQYWRAYAWNDASFLFMDAGHGGDWEGIAVHLDADLQPIKVAFLQHTGIVYETGRLQWNATHLLVWSEEGGHASSADYTHNDSTRWVAQQTWTGGTVTDTDGAPLGRSGGLRNVGEKSRPRNGQLFVQYSGLWGSRRGLFATSGYWGPAFNETEAQCANGASAYKGTLRYAAESSRCGRVFIRAWCDGINRTLLDSAAECYAVHDSP